MTNESLPPETADESWGDYLAPVAVAYDVDANGQAETVAVDSDSDGVADTVFVDTDEDGAADAVVLDTNADGVTDTTMFYLDQDGVVEETVGSGADPTADQYSWDATYADPADDITTADVAQAQEDAEGAERFNEGLNANYDVLDAGGGMNMDLS